MDIRKEERVKKEEEVREGNGLSAPADEHRAIVPANPDVTLHGIPGFHNKEEVGDHVHMAPMELDKDGKTRAKTGTGDQPGNSGGSRFATHSGDEE